MRDDVQFAVYAQEEVTGDPHLVVIAADDFAA